jgi:hypothetical protein
MKEKKGTVKLPLKQVSGKAKPDPLEYPVSEDIYNQSQKEKDMDPETIYAVKTGNTNKDPGANPEDDSAPEITGTGLDIPGSELDDEQETIGNEDEENNYYSLGGDIHTALEEDKGE